jgi:hypothetical protein
VGRIKRRLGNRTSTFKVITPPVSLVRAARRLLPGRLGGRRPSGVRKIASYIRGRRLVLKKNKHYSK